MVVGEASEAVTFLTLQTGHLWWELGGDTTYSKWISPAPGSIQRKRKGSVFCPEELQKQVLPKEWKKLSPVLSRENTLFATPSSSGIEKLD